MIQKPRKSESVERRPRWTAFGSALKAYVKAIGGAGKILKSVHKEFSSATLKRWQSGQSLPEHKTITLLRPDNLGLITKGQDLGAEIHARFRDLETSWRRAHAIKQGAPTELATLVDDYKDSSIKDLPGFGWRGGLSLQMHPYIDKRVAWRLEDVVVEDTNNDFPLTEEQQESYRTYFRDNYEREDFADDRVKFMLVANPAKFTDSVRAPLRLSLMHCRYSQVRYFQSRVLQEPSLRQEMIRGFVEDGKVTFPYDLALGLVVITADNRVVTGQRTFKTSWGSQRGVWAITGEEDFSSEDLSTLDTHPLASLTDRTLFEELSITKDEYDLDQFRLLSVYLEVVPDCVNAALCALIHVNVPWPKLHRRLMAGIAPDNQEYTQWNTIEFAESPICEELIVPKPSYSVGSLYRLAMLARYSGWSDRLVARYYRQQVGQ